MRASQDCAQGGPAAPAARLTTREAGGCLGSLLAYERAQRAIGAGDEHLLQCMAAILKGNGEVGDVFCVAALVQERSANSIHLRQAGKSEIQIVVLAHPQP